MVNVKKKTFSLYIYYYLLLYPASVLFHCKTISVDEISLLVDGKDFRSLFADLGTK